MDRWLLTHFRFGGSHLRYTHAHCLGRSHAATGVSALVVFGELPTATASHWMGEKMLVTGAACVVILLVWAGLLTGIVILTRPLGPSPWRRLDVGSPTVAAALTCSFLVFLLTDIVIVAGVTFGLLRWFFTANSTAPSAGPAHSPDTHRRNT